jgi:hypothetical protein
MRIFVRKIETIFWRLAMMGPDNLRFNIHQIGAGNIRWDYDAHRDKLDNHLSVDAIYMNSKNYDATLKVDTTGTRGSFEVSKGKGKTVDTVSFDPDGAKVSRQVDGKSVPVTDASAQQTLTHAYAIAKLPLQHAMEQAGYSHGDAETASEEVCGHISGALQKLGPTSPHKSNLSYLKQGDTANVTNSGGLSPVAKSDTTAPTSRVASRSTAPNPHA